MVIIYLHIIVLKSTMLYATYFEIGPPGSGEEDFKGGLPHMGMAAILPWIIYLCIPIDTS